MDYILYCEMGRLFTRSIKRDIINHHRANTYVPAILYDLCELLVENLPAIFSGLALLLSAIIGIITVPATIKGKRSEDRLRQAEIDQIRQGISSDIQTQYQELLEDMNTKMTSLRREVNAFKSEVILYKKYINYLLKGIEQDEGATFEPITLEKFEATNGVII
jgi:hypothetical protein